MIVHDLADLYGVSTKRLNEQVRRNRQRFPADFMFQLTAVEKTKVVANCGHLARLKYSSVLPYAFTDYGALMLANVLRSETAIQISIEIIRIFVKMRAESVAIKKIIRKINEMEKKSSLQFKAVFEAIRLLMVPHDESGRQIGFHST